MNNSKILVIDDDPIIANSVCRRLIKRGYDVDYEISGHNILDKLAIEEYDLILLDLKMPKISGPEVLKLVRENNTKNLLPIIMFSSSDNDQDVIDSLGLGANDFITKPVNINLLISKIHTHLELKCHTLQFAKEEQLNAIKAMITTYNHEINNSLAISMGQLSNIKKENYLPSETYDKLYMTQMRIYDVVKKINKLSQQEEINFTNYSDNSKMVKI